VFGVTVYLIAIAFHPVAIFGCRTNCNTAGTLLGARLFFVTKSEIRSKSALFLLVVLLGIEREAEPRSAVLRLQQLGSEIT
jgi:hypothetical protein